MRHQVGRLKHVALRQGVKPARALTATLVAVGMMAAAAISFVPTSANADPSLAGGALCRPTTIDLGDNTGNPTVDSGVATYVGGNMYVGANNQNNGSAYSRLNENQAPDKSYAVEAEGLTLVNGKLAINSAKKSWERRGFRFGVVGFGGQYRPESGSDVLVVGGNSPTLINSPTLTMNDHYYNESGQPNSQSVSVLGGWADGNTARGFVNTGKVGESSYTAKIDGPTSVPYKNGRKSDPSDQKYAPDGANYSRSVYDAGTTSTATGTSVQYNVKQPLSKVHVNGQDKDYSNFFKNNVQGLSEKLKNVTKTGKVKIGDADAKANPSYSRYHYRYHKDSQDGSYNTKYVFNFNPDSPGTYQQREKLITFSGTENPSLEVFQIGGSDLSSQGYDGISFAFTNISDTASVVINVTGSDSIDFHNGWRFWWHDQEISNGYVTTDANGAVTDGMRNAYSTAAQKIMWNFADTSQLTIRGGVADANYNKWGTSTRLTSQDDPAAAMLGSIMVPKGNFESHVTTNGRVYVGGDFSMYNPKNIGVVMAEGATASVIDMDQERHNLPWNGQLTSSCSTIAWSKVDTSSNPLGGTTWAVYGKKEDAVNGKNSLTTITDNDWNDGNPTDGGFQLSNLKSNATYYIQETATATGYQRNTNIYQINTGNDDTVSSAIVTVYDATGEQVDDNSAKLLDSSNHIINKKQGASIFWSKVDAEDEDVTLAGSTWNLTKYTDSARTEVESGWPKSIKDSTVGVKSIRIKDSTGEHAEGDILNDQTVNNPFSLSAVVYPADAPSGVVWSSENTYATVDAGSGLVTPKSNSGNEYAVIKACSTSKIQVCSSVKFKVTGSSGLTVTVSPHEKTIATGNTVMLTAVVNTSGHQVTWSSNNERVAKVSSNGVVTGVSAGTAIITASIEDGTFDSATITVTSLNQYLTLYFDTNQGSWNSGNLKVTYGKADGNWVTQTMQRMSDSCNHYANVQIPMRDINENSEFLIGKADGSDWYRPPSNANVPKSNGNFKFTSEAILPENVTISAGPSYSPTAPSGCTATNASVQSTKSAKVVRKAAKVATQADTNGPVNATQSDELPDEDTNPGAFRISHLEDGYYVLEETSEPNGFDVGGTYKITITNGQVTWDPAKSRNELRNKRKTGMVMWSKVDTTNRTKLLGGSEWKLIRTKSFSWVNGKASYTVASQLLATITDFVDSDSSETQCAASTKDYADIDGVAGQFKIRGLEWGEYQLVETKAPDGYDLDSAPHTFRIGPAEGADVTGEWYRSSGFTTGTTGAYDANRAFTVDGGSITNTPGVVLPDTGGEGVNKMYTAGFLAVAIAVAGLALSLRRRQ